MSRVVDILTRYNTEKETMPLLVAEQYVVGCVSLVEPVAENGKAHVHTTKVYKIRKQMSFLPFSFWFLVKQAHKKGQPQPQGRQQRLQ